MLLARASREMLSKSFRMKRSGQRGPAPAAAPSLRPRWSRRVTCPGKGLHTAQPRRPRERKGPLQAPERARSSGNPNALLLPASFPTFRPPQLQAPRHPTKASYVSSHIDSFVPNITLALDEKTAKWVKAHPEIGWSEVARQAIRRKIRELHALDAAFAESELTPADIERLTRKAKERLLREVAKA